MPLPSRAARSNHRRLLSLLEVFLEPRFHRPDDVHETLLHSRWLDFFGKMEPWLEKYLKKAEKPPVIGPGGAGK